MINEGRRRGICSILGIGVATAMLWQPMDVSATEINGGNYVLQQAGIASMFSVDLTQEEYVNIAKEAVGASWGYTNIGIANQESGNLNVRAEASTKGKLVGKMCKNAGCEVLDIDKESGWAHIKSGEVEGYVSTEFLLVGPEARLRANELVEKVVIADTDGLRVRDEADVNSAVMTQILKGEELEFVEELDGWYKVYVDSEEGYVSAEFAHVEESLDTAVTMTELLYGMGVSDVRVELCEYAKQFVGNPYVWGGTSLTKGADCSGFVLSVYKKFGVKLPHYSVSQSNSGTKISKDELQAGDLIFYADSSGTINHVAIYLGGNQVIHASNPKSGIKISKYNYRTPVKYVRILQD